MKSHSGLGRVHKPEKSARERDAIGSFSLEDDRVVKRDREGLITPKNADKPNAP